MRFSAVERLRELDFARYSDAELLLPRVGALSDPGNKLDGVRLRWLQGRTWTGLGRKADRRS